MAERLASPCGQSVLVVERREHVAGNAYDRLNEHGVLVHDHGPHILHTNSATGGRPPVALYRLAAL